MKSHSRSRRAEEEPRRRVEPSPIIRKIRLSLALALALAGALFAATASHGATLLFNRNPALPGDVITAGTGISGGTIGVNYFRIGVTISEPLHLIPFADNNGDTVQFQIPFGTPPGLTTISLYQSEFSGAPVASASFTVLASVPPIFTSPAAAQGTNGVDFVYVITAINNPTNITATPLPAGLALSTSGSVIGIIGTPTVSGIFEVPITAKGEHPTTTTATLTLIIHPKPPTITSALGVLGTNSVSFSHQITTDNPATNFTALNLSATIPGLSLDAATGLISGTPTVTGTFNIAIGAENGPFADTGKILTIVLDPPKPAITSALTASGRKGDQFTYVIAASNSPTSYTASPLPDGLTLAGATIAGIPSAAGNYNITITASNAGGTDEKVLQLTVLPRVPIISSLPTASGVDGSPFSYQITALNDPTSFAAGTRPAWLMLNESTGELSGTATGVGQFVVAITASNPGGMQTIDLTITIAPAIPIITSAATATATRGSAFSFQVTADNAPTDFSATGLPAGLSINNSSGLITGMATTLGASTVSLSAANVTGTGMGALQITVVDPIPAITSAGTASGRRDVDFSHQITADNNPVSYAVVGSLPPGVSLNPTSGLISGRPSVAGIYSVTVRAINSGGNGDKTLTITITEKVPVITSLTTASATGGSLFTYSIEANNNPISFNIVKGAATWLDVDTETGQVSGIPPLLSFVVQQQIQLLAINAGGTGTLSLTITISPSTPVITSATTVSGAANSPFQYQIVANNLPSGYQIGGFPAGYSVDMNTGLITGAPTAEGSFTGQIFASNAGGTGFAMLSVTIHRPIPSITSPLTASGVTGQTFAYQIAATQNPETFSVDLTPPGLTFDANTGLLSGIPTQTGLFHIQIGAGHAGGVGFATLSLQIGDPPAPTITSALEITANSGTTFNYQITAASSPTSFNATQRPRDLAVNTQTGVIEGVLLKPGIFEIKLSASNATGTGEATLRLIVWSSAGEPPVGVFPSTGNQLRILWPAAASGYVLQSAPDLTPPVNWTDVVAAPSTVGGTMELLIDASSGGQYYRLLNLPP